ncbi:MAG: glycosyltransferase [Porticoccaceae bacterium]|nr:glycosyltransferase [Porticoccaceae bacterium]
MPTNLKVFIGWDSREDIAYQVAKHSILKHNPNIEVYPLKLYELREKGIYSREDDKKGSTEFTISRFLVPFLSGYKGHSLFMDCDMICLDDLEFVLEFQDAALNPVSCVQHDYSPKSKMKMDGQMQHIYPRKNWSSVMLFNNSKCKNLTPDIVNTETPMYLHRMLWADEKIGSLPVKFNFLAGYYDFDEEQPILIHYTDGGPWFKEYRDCPHGDLWKNEVKEMFDL